MLHRPTSEIIADALAQAIRPPERISLSDWCARNLIVADGPLSGHPWDPDLTPQLCEVLDCLSLDHPCTTVVLRKSAQVGATQIGIGWMLAMIALAPTKAMIIFPTLTSVQDYNREKLQPTIDATAAVRRLVYGQKSRSSAGSTSMVKRFPGGSIILTGANSSVDLRSKTVQIQHRDEIDDWPHDLEGQGDPEEMADARMIAFHALGRYKVFKSSTPTIRGISRIDAAFEKGDQRYWMVRCPHCGHEQRLVFGAGQEHGLKFSHKPPHNAHYVCAGNGCIIEHHEKAELVRGGRWVATNPDGLYPSFHLDALSSLLTTWDKIAEAWVAAKDNPQKLKGFVNLWLGESWEERGEAPEWQQLMARREEWPRNAKPADALLITMAIDVQQDGLFYEVVGWGRDKQSWVLDCGFLPGATADPRAEVWQRLTEIADRRYGDPWGRTWAADVIGVDAGYNTEAVFSWVQRRPNALALKGMPGWFRPALGTPAKMQVSRSGRRRRGKMVWPVGTWPLKSEFYALLRKPGRHAGEEDDPPGYCHFGMWCDERYFKQLTAECLRERESKGRIVKEWVAGGDNHFHDCRIYNMALWSYLGGDRMTDDQWAAIIKQRGAPAEDDLLARAMPEHMAETRRSQRHDSNQINGQSSTRTRRRRSGWMDGVL